MPLAIAEWRLVVYDAPDLMRDTWHAIRVGLMVLLGLAAIVAVYRYVDERSSSDGGYTVFARFDDVQGLIPKSRVAVAGIPIGFIESIRLEGSRARVDIQINGDVPLYTDARVAVRSVSLLGERMLAINPGTPGSETLLEGDEIKVALEGVSTDDVLVTVGEIAESLKKVTTQFERAFGSDEAGNRMDAALLSLTEALEAINRTVQTNEESVGNILANIELATRDVSEILHARRDDIDRGVAEVDDTIVAIRNAAEELDAVLEDVHEVTERTARGEGTIGRLTQDDTLIDEVEGIAEGIGDIVGGISRLRTIVELRSEYNFLAKHLQDLLFASTSAARGALFLASSGRRPSRKRKRYPDSCAPEPAHSRRTRHLPRNPNYPYRCASIQRNARQADLFCNVSLRHHGVHRWPRHGLALL